MNSWVEKIGVELANLLRLSSFVSVSSTSLTWASVFDDWFQYNRQFLSVSLWIELLLAIYFNRNPADPLLFWSIASSYWTSSRAGLQSKCASVVSSVGRNNFPPFPKSRWLNQALKRRESNRVNQSTNQQPKTNGIERVYVSFRRRQQRDPKSRQTDNSIILWRFFLSRVTKTNRQVLDLDWLCSVKRILSGNCRSITNGKYLKRNQRDRTTPSSTLAFSLHPSTDWSVCKFHIKQCGHQQLSSCISFFSPDYSFFGCLTRVVVSFRRSRRQHWPTLHRLQELYYQTFKSNVTISLVLNNQSVSSISWKEIKITWVFLLFHFGLV